MAHTVSANTLTISHKGTGGYEMNSTPDVCLTPAGPVPVPYMILSFSKDLIRGSKTVFADGGNTIDIKGSAHSRCTGDEPGTAKGVASGTNMHESTWITYSPDVYVEGKNICRLSDKMFMNNKNCISGTGGHYEVPASVTDPIMKELCKIFCEARDEWHACKAKGGKCPRPSTIAKGKLDNILNKPGHALNKAIARRFPGAFGAAEKTFFSTADKIFDGARKIYDKSGMQNAIKRQVEKLMKRKLIQQGAKMAGRAWLKLIPGLNIISTIVDVVDTAMTVKDVYDMISNSDFIMDKAIKVKPDFSVHGPDGDLKEVYDFKFDDPKTGYLDDWQEEQKQEKAYKQASGGKDPTKVDNATCKCDRGKGTPSIPMM
jgi:hypothetical protein